MRTRALLTVLICSVLCSAVCAQKVLMPSKGNNIVYDGTVNVNHNFNGDYVCSKLKSWVIAATKEYHLDVQRMSDEGCTITINASTAIDKGGNFNDVDCSFNLVINIAEEGLNYQLTDLVFNKAQHQYSVNEVYSRYRQNDPYVKAVFENKQAALRRHEFLLNALDKRMTALTSSLKTYMLQMGMTK